MRTPGRHERCIFAALQRNALGNSGQITLRQRRSHPVCQDFAFCVVVMLKALRFFEGRNAYDLTPFEADHARLDDLFGVKSRPA